MRLPASKALLFGIIIQGLVLNISRQGNLAAQTIGERVDKIRTMPDGLPKLDSIINFAVHNRKDSATPVLITDGLKLARGKNLHGHEARLLDCFGVYKRDHSDFSDALALHNQALDLARRFKIDSIEMFALNNIGVVYRRLDQNTDALNYHMQALRIADKINHDYSKSVSLNSIGNIKIALGNYTEAIGYFEKCLPIAIKAGNDLGIAMNYGNIGECYDRMNQLDSAKKYYNLSLEHNKMLSEEKERERGIAICFGSLGNIYKKEGKYTVAQSLFERGLEINKKLKDKIYIAQSYNFLGDIKLLQNNGLEAKRDFLDAVQIALSIRSTTEIKTAYEGLMKVYEKEKDFENAFRYGTLVKLYTDSINLENNYRHIRDVEAKYQNESEQAKIKLLETTRKNDRVIMIGSLILFALLLITAILYYLRNRLIERNKGLQRELDIRSQIATDLHDDMGSTLSSIHIFSELLRKPGARSEELLTKIEENAKDTLEALDDIIWLVKPSNDKFSNLSMHIRQYAIPLFEGKDINFQIDFPESISELPIPMETRRNIFLIMKESINNMVKYSQCTEAIVSAEYIGDDILFTVKDNGKGFDPKMTTNRNGIKNLKARANQINADLNIKSAPGEGTEIKLLVRSREMAAP